MLKPIRPYGVFLRLCHLLALVPLLLAVPALAREQLILAFGDSLTAGYQLPAADSFPAQLQTQLRSQGLSVRVHNAGVSGDTTAQGRARLPWVLNSLKQKPDLVIVALGANDMLRGASVAEAERNLDAILTELGKRDIPVLLAGMLSAPNMGRQYGERFEAIFPALAKKHGATLYPFFLDGVAAQPKLLLTDGMHPNKAGVAVMVKRISPNVRAALPR